MDDLTYILRKKVVKVKRCIPFRVMAALETALAKLLYQVTRHYNRASQIFARLP